MERALSHLHTVGREQAMQDFHEKAGPFVDRDMYLFGVDRQGVYLIQGSKPSLIGQSFNSVPGLDAGFIDRIWQAADAGGGWVQYSVENPLTGAVTPKESYVLTLEDGCAIGCGVYRHDADTHRARAVAWSVQASHVAEMAGS